MNASFDIYKLQVILEFFIKREQDLVYLTLVIVILREIQMIEATFRVMCL